MPPRPFCGGRDADQPGQSLHPQPYVRPIGTDDDPFDKVPDDPRLLGREQFVPHGIENLQRRARLLLRQAGHFRPRRQPRADDDFRLADQGTHLRHDGSLDFWRGYAVHQRRVFRRAALQGRLTDVVAILPAPPYCVRGRQGPPVHPEDQPTQQRRRSRPVLKACAAEFLACKHSHSRLSHA